MLFDIFSNKPISRLPHSSDFHNWVCRLSNAKYDLILDTLNKMIDSDQIHTTSWLPGKDWRGTAFQPIYEDACNSDHSLSGMRFGQIVFLAMMDRPEAWACGRYENNGVPIQSLTYFRIPQLDHLVPVGHGCGSSGYVWAPKNTNRRTGS